MVKAEEEEVTQYMIVTKEEKTQYMIWVKEEENTRVQVSGYK